MSASDHSAWVDRIYGRAFRAEKELHRAQFCQATEVDRALVRKELQRMGYCPDGPVEFARKATPAQRELVMEWARENAPFYDEAEQVLAMLGGQQAAA